ncbi:phospholipid transfer protein [Astyanax mexicanus]|uniref:phospholipid transfer protein n=1 Tax=Astyanax mexicanus TaxID=7994 RepID=UPI0020CAB159|nr:phospholipid transfer protein [Astyanax mexicanus]XP_049335445.1 phospholipid transfer protein [Astyanax mexicanus]
MGVYGAAIIFLLLPLVAKMSEIPPGCKIRITSKGLEMLKHETQKFVEEELGHITMPEMHGKEGRFQYSITNVKITELNLTAALGFQPTSGLLFEVHNSSITVNFQRRILYWFFIDEGPINASAEGVNIHTALELAKDELGRLKIANASCDASIAKMRAKFGGTLGRVYDFIATFLTTGMRFLLNQQICPALNHAALVLVNQLLETIPVRAEVDSYVGIDYSLLSDPVVTGSSLDMDFRGMFYNLHNLNDTLTNYAGNPVVREYDRMIYLALSEYFFDSALYSYFKGGVFTMHIANDRMPKDLEMLLRTTYFGAIMMLNPALMEAPISLELEVTSAPTSTIKTSGASVLVHSGVRVLALPPGKPPIQLSSMTMESKFNAKVSMKGKRLAIYLDLRRFKIFSNQSALESLALIPLQAPLKTMLQITVVPLINNYTKRGVRIPLPDGIDFIEEVVEYHNGYIIVGANLHFTSGLRELIAKKMSGESEAEEQ